MIRSSDRPGGRYLDSPTHHREKAITVPPTTWVEAPCHQAIKPDEAIFARLAAAGVLNEAEALMDRLDDGSEPLTGITAEEVRRRLAYYDA